MASNSLLANFRRSEKVCLRVTEYMDVSRDKVLPQIDKLPDDFALLLRYSVISLSKSNF